MTPTPTQLCAVAWQRLTDRVVLSGMDRETRQLADELRQVYGERATQAAQLVAVHGVVAHAWRHDPDGVDDEPPSDAPAALPSEIARQARLLWAGIVAFVRRSGDADAVARACSKHLVAESPALVAAFDQLWHWALELGRARGVAVASCGRSVADLEALSAFGERAHRQLVAILDLLAVGADDDARGVLESCRVDRELVRAMAVEMDLALVPPANIVEAELAVNDLATRYASCTGRDEALFAHLARASSAFVLQGQTSKDFERLVVEAASLISSVGAMADLHASEESA